MIGTLNCCLYKLPNFVEICPVTRWWAVRTLDWRRWRSLISSYVVECIVWKRQWLPPYGCNYLIYVMILPCSLQKPLTRNQMLFNVWLHVRTYHSGILPKYHISYKKYHSTYHVCIFHWHHFSRRIFPLTPLFHWDLPISIVSTL